MMENMRNNPPKEIAGEKVLSVGDYLAQTICYTDSGKCESTNLPKSNVLYYDLTMIAGAVYALLEQNLKLNSIWV